MCSMLFKASNHSCSTLLRLALAAHRDLVGISPNPAMNRRCNRAISGSRFTSMSGQISNQITS
jgi:hypothetical protein